MTEPRTFFDILTAAIWFGLALMGIVRRIRRLIRLNQIILPEPLNPLDEDYLASVKWSTYLRLTTKIVLLLGSLIALFGLPLFEFWRLGIVLLLVLMNIETVSVDKVRERLGNPVQESGAEL